MFAVVGLVILIASFILPWWGAHSESDEKDVDGDYHYHSESGYGISVTNGIGGIVFGGGGTSLYSGEFQTPVVFGITTMLLILALIFTSLMITAIALSLFGKLGKRKLPMIFGILALIFCILAPVVFMAALPGAMKADAQKQAEDRDDDYEEPDHDDPTKSFFGNYEDIDEDEYSIDKTKRYWGGDIGWFLAYISFVMVLIAVIMAAKTPRPSAQYPPPPPRPGFEPAPPPPAPRSYEPPPPPQQQYEPYPPTRDYTRSEPTRQYDSDQSYPPPRRSRYDYPPERERYPPRY